MRDSSKKRKALPVLLLAAVLAVAACNADDGADHHHGDHAPEVSSPDGAEGENGKGTETDGTASDEAAGEEESGDEPVAAEPPAESMEVEVEVEGMKETRTGTLAMTDNGYYMYVIPPYAFTPEEPGADLVFMEAFPDYSMRIQPLPEDTDLSLVRENAEAELKAISDVVEELKGDQIYDPALREAKFYLQAIGDDLVKKIIVMEVDGRLFRFTMFLPIGGEASEGAESGFIAMIKTVRPTAIPQS